MTKDNDPTPQKNTSDNGDANNANHSEDAPKEIGGRKGLDPVRYGDWEIAGKCVDF